MIYVLRIVFCSMYELNGSSLYIVRGLNICGIEAVKKYFIRQSSIFIAFCQLTNILG